jgi:hypothetical protein
VATAAEIAAAATAEADHRVLAIAEPVPADPDSTDQRATDRHSIGHVETTDQRATDRHSIGHVETTDQPATDRHSIGHVETTDQPVTDQPATDPEATGRGSIAHRETGPPSTAPHSIGPDVTTAPRVNGRHSTVRGGTTVRLPAALTRADPGTKIARPSIARRLIVSGRIGRGAIADPISIARRAKSEARSTARRVAPSTAREVLDLMAAANGSPAAPAVQSGRSRVGRSAR